MDKTMATGQIPDSAAEVYEKFFIPALFDQWAGPLLDVAGVRSGQRLLDVGAGTGVVARAALRRVGTTGSVVAVDPNVGMLRLAKELAPGLDARRGVAEELPVADDDVDVATCQFALMFFSDTQRAMSELTRVVRPGGRVAIATWAAARESPGYAAMIELLADEIGDWAADALRAPFCLGTVGELADVLRPAFPEATIRHRMGRARFGSLDEWLHTDIRGWTLADRIDDDQFARLRERALARLQRFVGADGGVSFDAPALIVTATVS